MRLVFFGSPDFALPTLDRLLRAGHEVVRVVSQPGKPVGRGGSLRDPAVARQAKALGLPLFQPASLKDQTSLAALEGDGADAFVVVAYGKILPSRVLGLPRLGALNVHGSLLPRWRGASPVQAALLAGDDETGVSIMKMEEGMDTGPVFAERRTPIEPGDDAGTLSRRLADLGAELLVETLRAAGEGPTTAVRQNDSLATYCPKITRDDGRIDWTLSAETLVRRERAFTPWPGLFTFRSGKRVKLFGSVLRESGRDQQPGTVLVTGSGLIVQCGTDAVEVSALQVEGRRVLAAPDFVRGERVTTGEVWGP